MDIEHFKRWCAITQPKKGEMMKSDDKPKFIIPLNKGQRGLQTVSGKLEPSMAAQLSPAGNRAVHLGTAVNIVMGSPKMNRPDPIKGATFDPKARDSLEQLLHHRKGRKKDKKDYEVSEPSIREPHPFYLPEDYVGHTKIEIQELRKRKKRAIDEHEKNLGRPKNKVTIH